ncbi:MAG: ADP-ribosylglycohydrolase family protein [Planctomycetes bacterium]|nr:ADP-ribosylglycohydrolase family protein [Planctomycetota bacterium]
MLLEIAIGDAYGAGFEYVKPKLVRAGNDLSRYVQHPRHGTAPGAYTDDTQMSLAMAEALLEEIPWTPEDLAQKFLDAFHRDPREGYSSHFYDFLCRTQRSEEFLANIRPESEKSGASMRAGPLGVLPNTADVIGRSQVQAALTHNTPLGIAAATASALASHYCYHRVGPKAELGRFLDRHVPGDWSAPWKGKVGSSGWMSVRAAVTAIIEHDRASDVLRACIAYTGDVDTVAAVAMGPASWCDEIEQDLPACLHDGLERGPFGYDYLASIDQRLEQMFPRPRHART